MKKLFFIILFLSCTHAVKAQLGITGQASVAYIQPNSAESQNNSNFGKKTFAWRLDIFADALISENITFLSNVRMLQDQIPHVDLFAIRFSDIASSGLNIEVGEVDLPFGNLEGQRFPKENPFLTLPLMNEYYTSLCASDYNLWTFSPEYQMNGDGVRLLDQGLYDLGVKVYGNYGIIDYGFAIINGMVSATGTYTPNGLNPNHGLGKVGRIAVTPFQGLTIGFSYGEGPFMKDVSEDTLSLLRNKNPEKYIQRIEGSDLDFSFEHFVFHAEVISNRWGYVQNAELSAVSYTAMMQYALTTRFSAALRAGTISFNKINILEYIGKGDEGYSGPLGFVRYTNKWDRDALRLESAFIYRLERDLLIKISYQINRTYGFPKDPVDNVFAIQTVLSF